MADTGCTQDASPSFEGIGPERQGSPSIVASIRTLTVGTGCAEGRLINGVGCTLPIPGLRIQGRWLERAGFWIGAKVHVYPGRLVIEVQGGPPTSEVREWTEFQDSAGPTPYPPTQSHLWRRRRRAWQRRQLAAQRVDFNSETAARSTSEAPRGG